METAPSHREEDELDHHQAKYPIAFERAKPSGPATPSVAGRTPGNLAAVSKSLEMALVWKLWLGISEMVWGPGAAKLLWLSWVSVSGPSPPLWTVITQHGEVLLIREGVETNLAQVSMFKG